VNRVNQDILRKKKGKLLATHALLAPPPLKSEVFLVRLVLLVLTQQNWLNNTAIFANLVTTNRIEGLTHVPNVLWVTVKIQPAHRIAILVLPAPTPAKKDSITAPCARKVTKTLVVVHHHVSRVLKELFQTRREHEIAQNAALVTTVPSLVRCLA